MFVHLYREGGILQYPNSHLQLENALGLNIIILERVFYDVYGIILILLESL